MQHIIPCSRSRCLLTCLLSLDTRLCWRLKRRSTHLKALEYLSRTTILPFWTSRAQRGSLLCVGSNSNLQINKWWSLFFFKGTIDPDPMKPETNKFSPVVHLNPTSADRRHVTLTEPSDGVLPVFLFQTGPPVMLQAYAISNYQGPDFWFYLGEITITRSIERRPINGKLPKPLFTKSIDISKLREVWIFWPCSR